MNLIYLKTNSPQFQVSTKHPISKLIQTKQNEQGETVILIKKEMSGNPCWENIHRRLISKSFFITLLK